MTHVGICAGVGGGADGLSAGLDGHLLSFRERWQDGSWEDGIPRVASGVRDRTKRLHALGNAILPQWAYEIAKAIADDIRRTRTVAA